MSTSPPKKSPHSLGNSSKRHPSKTNTLQAKCYNRARGVTSVEFAIAGSVFFLFLFMVMDFALYGFVKLSMQHAVREGARYAVTGRVDLDPQNAGDRNRAIIKKIKENSIGYFDSVMTESDIEVTDNNGRPISGFGAPKETIVVKLNCQWPILNPFMQVALSQSHYNFSVSASMRNESFPGGTP